MVHSPTSYPCRQHLFFQTVHAEIQNSNCLQPFTPKSYHDWYPDKQRYSKLMTWTTTGSCHIAFSTCNISTQNESCMTMVSLHDLRLPLTSKSIHQLLHVPALWGPQTSQRSSIIFHLLTSKQCLQQKIARMNLWTTILTTFSLRFVSTMLDEKDEDRSAMLYGRRDDNRKWILNAQNSIYCIVL